MKFWNKNTKRATLLWLAFEAAAAVYVAYDVYDNNQERFSSPNPHANFIPEEKVTPQIKVHLSFVKTLFNTMNEILISDKAKNDIEMLDRVIDTDDTNISASQAFLDYALEENSADSITRILEMYRSFLQDGKISEDENKWVNSALTRFKPSTEFQSIQDQKNLEIRQTLAQNGRFSFLSSQWVDSYAFVSDEQAGEQFEIRRELAQIISDTVRKVHGYDPIPVYVSNEILPFGGFYYGCGTCSLEDFEDINLTLPEKVDIESIQKGFIWLQNHISFSMMTTYRSFLKVVLEEAKHSVDGEIRTEFEKGLIDKADINYQHAAMLYLNGLSTTYGIPTKFTLEEDGTLTIDITTEPLVSETRIGKFFEVSGNVGKFYWKMYQDFRDYKEQYLERTAKEFAGDLLKDITYDQYCNDSYVRCIANYYIPGRPSFF